MKSLVTISALVILFIASSCGTDTPKQPRYKAAAASVRQDYSALRTAIDSIARSTPGKLGVALTDLSTGDTMSYNGGEHFAMFSTYKFPLVLYVLHQVGQGAVKLNQGVLIAGRSFKNYRGGRFIDTHPPKDINLPVDSLIWYAMAYSDNITTDHLFGLVGGPAAVDSFIRDKGISGMAIRNTVLEMGMKKLYKNNWCTPDAMTRLLTLFHEGKILNRKHTDYLMRYMEAAPSGAKRIKGLLPEETVVAHKTGTGGTVNGVTEGLNDVGIITLPGGRKLVLSVYLNDIALDMEAGEAVVARIAKIVYDDAVRIR